MSELKGTENKNGILMKDLEDGIEHGICVSNLAYYISKEMKMEESLCHEMAVAGMLHDIGKMKLSFYLYGRNEDTLRIEEMKYVRSHSKISYEILKVKEYSDFILDSVLYHHENYDGSGYPQNLEGDVIPIGARILRVCDVYAALTSDRPYRSAFDSETAIELMIDEVKNFDMKIFLAFQKVINQDIIFNKINDNLLEELKYSVSY